MIQSQGHLGLTPSSFSEQPHAKASDLLRVQGLAVRPLARRWFSVEFQVTCAPLCASEQKDMEGLRNNARKGKCSGPRIQGLRHSRHEALQLRIVRSCYSEPSCIERNSGKHWRLY